jgi:two-component system sensor histidine kinase BaeS
MRPWQELAGEKGQRWEATVPADLPPIMADPMRLSQAIGNLASNAVKYTPADGAICVTTGESDEEVWIKVCDTGPGIASEELDAIFTPFFRGAQEKRIKQGMGLGLTIARDVVVAHGGHIDVQSEPGAGSHFCIYLPRSIPALPPVPPDERAPARPLKKFIKSQ